MPNQMDGYLCPAGTKRAGRTKLSGPKAHLGYEDWVVVPVVPVVARRPLFEAAQMIEPLTGCLGNVC